MTSLDDVKLDWLSADANERAELERALVAPVCAALSDASGSAAAHANAMALACRLFEWQRRRCDAIDRVARGFGAPAYDESRVAADPLAAIDAVPGVPTDAFKSARIACFSPAFDARVFRTSGTTADVRGVHALPTLAFYDRAALSAGARWLLDPATKYRFVILAPDPRDVSDSSLGYMIDRFVARWSDGASPVWLVSQGELDHVRLAAELDHAANAQRPVALLGATFAFVHAHDELSPNRRWALAPGSVAMPTGGFKGRSRELAPDELFALLIERFGLTRAQIVQEYGMTELSSQAYEAHAEGGPVGRYYAPPWMRVRAVDPESLTVLPVGEHGLLKVIDLANVGSCVAVQTADVGVVHEDGGFEVFGRAAGATPRGCARALDALLSGEK